VGLHDAEGRQAHQGDAGRLDGGDAQNALAAALLGRDVPPRGRSPGSEDAGQLATEYLDFKRAKGKRSLADDALALTRRSLPWFGAQTLVTEMTALRIAQYDRERSADRSRLKRAVTPATVNRELALIRHMLRLAEEWGYIDKVPRVRLGTRGAAALSQRGGGGAASDRVRRVAEPLPHGYRQHCPLHGRSTGRDPRADVGAG
jgi:hypothetical protein